MNIRYMIRGVGVGLLSLTVAGCGTSSSTANPDGSIDGMKGISTVEKTSLKLYKSGEKSKYGMREMNSDGTYTYGAANVDTRKLRKVDDEVYPRGIDSNGYQIAYYWTLDGSDDFNNGIEFAYQDGDEKKALVSADIRFYIDDQSLQLYKDKGILPANATKKTARKMVETEIDYIAKLLKDESISKDGYDLKDKNDKARYEAAKAGYFTKLSQDKPEKEEVGRSFSITSHYEDSVVALLSKTNSKGDFRGAIKFIFLDNVYMNKKRNQILMKRYGLDSLLDKSVNENLYTYDESKLSSGIFGKLMKLYTKKPKEWYCIFSKIYTYKDYSEQYRRYPSNNLISEANKQE